MIVVHKGDSTQLANMNVDVTPRQGESYRHHDVNYQIVKVIWDYNHLRQPIVLVEVDDYKS